jgi:GT2 family glycosyltransferase
LLVVHRVSGTRGYSQNNNVALRAARGRYAAILNDDTILTDDLFGKVVRFLDARRDVVAVCPVLRYPNGSLQMGLRGRFTPVAFIAEQLRIDRLLPVRWAVRLGAFDRPWLPDGDGSPIDIEAGTGACFIARRDALEAIAFLDEAYFLGPDDIDWTIRLLRVGRVVLLPSASLIHMAGSTLSNAYHAVVPAVYAGAYTFFRRYYGRPAEWLVRVSLGCLWSSVLLAGWMMISLVRNSARARLMRRARWNCVRFAFSAASSPDVFARLINS